MAIKNVLALLAIAAVSACQSTPDKADRTDRTSKVVQAVSVDRLSPRVMEQGKCGLFVWQMNPETKLILFSQDSKSMADYWTGEAEIQILRTSSQGIESQGQSPTQSFELPSGQSIRLDLRNPEPVDNGTRYKGGTLTLPAQDLEMVMPVFGMTACKLSPVVSDYSVRTIR